MIERNVSRRHDVRAQNSNAAAALFGGSGALPLAEVSVADPAMCPGKLIIGLGRVMADGTVGFSRFVSDEATILHLAKHLRREQDIEPVPPLAIAFAA